MRTTSNPHGSRRRPPKGGKKINSAEGLNGSQSTTIQKVVRVMQALLTSNESLPLSGLADRLEMPKPTVHRLLRQLEDVGVVRRDLSGKDYSVGPTFLTLAVDALSVRARQPPIRWIMRKLVDHIGESCNLGILQDHEIVYLERVECDWPLRLQLHAGSRVPIHCTASGKLFLAKMSVKSRSTFLNGLQLKRFTDRTITNADSLEQECATIRTVAYSINNEEYHLGLIGLAVPVLRRDGTVVASLAVHAPSFRMSVDIAKTYVPLLRSAAAEIAIEAGVAGDK